MISDDDIASVSQRVYALTFDIFIIYIPIFYVLPGMLSKLFGIGQTSISLQVVAFIFGLLYEPIFVSFFGRTLGHKFMKIKVIDKDGQKIGFFPALARYITKIFLGVLSILSLIGSQQAIHDMIAKSYVVDE